MPRLFCLLLLIFTVAHADARAAFQTSEKMIATSEAIALVTIEKVEPVAVKGTTWTYRQRATARVERVLKGPLPTELTLYGDEDFICAQCRFMPGRALVFLKRDGNLWTGNNWQFGARPIENDRVQWFKKDAFVLESQPLDEVLKQLEMVLETQAKAPRFILSFQPAEPRWSITDSQAKESHAYKSSDLEAWIRTLPPGSEVSLASACLGEQPEAANLDRLAMICYFMGVKWRIVPAG